MKCIIHKWVLNAMTVPHSTQYTKFAKYMLTKQTVVTNSRDWSEIGLKRGCRIFVCRFAKTHRSI